MNTVENKLLPFANLEQLKTRFKFWKKGLSVKILVEVDEDTCETKDLVNTEILGCYSFVNMKKESKFVTSTFTDYYLKDYIILKNGYVLSLKDVEQALCIRRSFEGETLVITLAPKFADSFEETLVEYDYQPLDSVIDKHLNFIEEMKNDCNQDIIKFDKTHIHIIGEKEDGYAEEGLLSKEDNESVELGSPFSDDVISTRVLRTYKIDSVQSRYAYLNGKIEKRKIYKLIGTEKLAIESPIFAQSDVFLVNEDKAIIF